MEKISNFLSLILLFFFIISCNNSNDCCSNEVKPYEFVIANISKKERNISIKLYKKTNNNNIKSIKWSVSSYTQSILSEGNESITIELKENEEFALYFSPYENSIEDIGKEIFYYYEIYEDNKLIFIKKITIKSSYLDSKSKNHWELKTDILKVESKDYLKEINKNGYPFIKLEF
jgi:hypothetical protein